MVATFDEEGEDTSVSCIPKALLLFNPVFDNGPDGFEHKLVKPYWKEISPIDHIDDQGTTHLRGSGNRGYLHTGEPPPSAMSG